VQIDRNAPTPLYHQLKQLLIQQIELGLFPAGAPLPSEQELCTLYQISRAPVRQALAELVNEGRIYRRVGVGTFVTPQASVDPEPVLFKVLANDRWVQLFERVTADWAARAKQPRIHLEMQMPERSEFHQTLRDATVQGDAPDLVSVDYVWIAGYARANYIAPLETIDAAWVQTLRADLEPPVRYNHTLDGQLWGIPVQSDVTGLWLRRDWFAAEGLSAPVTWDEWRTLLVHFARPDVMTRWGHRCSLVFPGGVVAEEATLNVLLTLIWGAGGDVLDASGAFSLLHPAIIETLTFLRSLTESGYIAPEAPRLHWSDAPRMLAWGETPMTLGGTYEWPVIQESSPWKTEAEMLAHLDFVPMPRPSVTHAPVASLGGTSWVVMRQSDLKTLSCDLMQLAIQSPWLLQFYAQNCQLSPFRSLNHALAEASPWIRKILPLLSLARPRPLLPQYTRISRFLQQMFEQVLWQGAPIEDTLRQTQRYLTLLLED